jgi:Acyclic terpene utilisation family protein AtuA
MNRALRIGAGAGFSGDRIEPALELVQHGQLDYLGFECLAERTIGLAQAARQADSSAGFDPLLIRRMETVLPAAHARGIRIITNMGAANTLGAAQATVAVARACGLQGLKVAAVVGDDVLDLIRNGDFQLIDREGRSSDIRASTVSANAYLGAEGIVKALEMDADVVITGRVCDPALFLAPLIHEFGWKADDWDLLGRGTLVGHLLECAGQLTGGYFADPGFKDVPNLARLGFPLAEVAQDGSAIFTKVDGSGGRIDAATCKEQLLYEVLDPSAYVQADVIADFRSVEISELGTNRVRVSGGRGHARTDTLKVSISYEDGFVGHGQIAYAGPGARARAELAFEIVCERLKIIGAAATDLKLDLIGINALNRTGITDLFEPAEVVARISGRSAELTGAEALVAEIESLYTNGPAGGGGASGSCRKVLAVASTLIPRDAVNPTVEMLVA